MEQAIIPLVQEEGKNILEIGGRNEKKMRNEIRKGLVETKTNDLEPNSIWDKQIDFKSKCPGDY